MRGEEKTIGVSNVCTIDFCYIHFLGFHEGKCKSLHAHSGRVSVEVTGPSDKRGMVVDFGIVKRALKDSVNEWLDHKLIVSEKYTRVEGDTVEIRYTTSTGDHLLKLPKSEVTILNDEPLAENLADLIAKDVLERLPDRVTSVKVTMTEGLDNFAVGEATRTRKCSRRRGNQFLYQCQRCGTQFWGSIYRPLTHLYCEKCWDELRRR